MIKNCYIHIPFCNNICSYCDFCKLYYNELFVDKYLDMLEKEINDIYQGEILDTIYIGGGTPSSLTEKQLDKLFKIIKKFRVSDNLEYTIEGNIENTTLNKLKIYKKYGINRLSFGVESINKKNLELLERSSSCEEIKTVINNARLLGFNNINVDLIYAIPKEDLNVLKKDLDFIISLDVEHISTYSLIIENHTKLKIYGVSNISEEKDYEMYNYICKYLKEYGYNHYEISNFSKEGYYSRHNLTYWNNREYYGFGLGASSYIKRERIINTRSINKYLLGNYLLDKELINNEIDMEYQVLLNLRKSSGINMEEFKNKYNISLKDKYNYDWLVKNNLLKIEDNNIFIPEEKWYISNEIIIKLLENRDDYE